MSSRNVLIVVLESVPDEKIRTAIQIRKEVADVTVHVVAPAVSAGMLQWLTGAEDEARAEAGKLAARTAEVVEADVETEVGDRNPLVAVGDALSTFSADEIVVAGEASAESEAALRRFGLPVSRANGRSRHVGDPEGHKPMGRELARGLSSQTPVVLLGVVGGVVLAAVALISLIAFLVFWLT